MMVTIGKNGGGNLANQNKKKGFTLIELLAVIVILAVIALIATPIIMGVINDSKKNAAKDSVYGYVKVLELAIAKDTDENSIVPTGQFILKNDGTLTSGKKVIKVTHKGTIPTKGEITVTTGIVKYALLTIDGYNTVYDGNKVEVLDKGTKKYNNGTIVYYNPDTGKKCSDYAVANSNTNVKTGCMKWYTFNDEVEDSTVNLLLDHNTSWAAWNSAKTNTVMNEVQKALINDTKNWSDGINPRLIDADEVAKITGNTTWNSAISTSSYFYFDTNTTSQSATCKEGNITGCNYGWLYDRTHTDCLKLGCANAAVGVAWGYWTTSPSAASSLLAWTVDHYGHLITNAVETGIGIRPVVTLKKSELS